MRKKILIVHHLVVWGLILLVALPPGTLAQQPAAAPVFKQEELDQVLAPIALYPDSLVSQILMASTYPLEIVQADRWVKQNKDLKGDALAKALEKQTWDPSVRSLVNFPQVLAMMSEKLDVTQKLGDAFLAQQKDVMATIQKLRAKAQAEGNLKTTKEQKVIVEQAAPQTTIIKIEPVNPQVVYVPTYNPTVVYGAWPYPAYPPYPYYPPGYVATAAFSFAAGVAIGSAWGYAWGSPDYHGGNVKVNYNQNVNINNNINRQQYAQQQPAGGQGNWQHNPANRQGVPYNGQSVQQRYNQATPSQQVQARQAYRGHTGSALTPNEQQQAQQARQQQTGQQGQQQERAQQAQQARGGEQARTSQASGGASQFGSGASDRSGSGSHGGAFAGIEGGGSSARSASQRGSASRSSSGGGGRSGGGGGGRRR